MSVDPLSATSQTPPSSRNRWVLNKLTSHFGHRNRNISEFYVQPDDPWRTYFPGDVIKGTVVLTVVKPVRITHLVVCLHGFVKVFKNTVAPGEAGPEIGFLGPGRGRRGGQYLGNGLATLFEDELVLCGDGRLKEGIYKFQFELELPPYSLPSSINFERGTISYVITSTLTRPTTISPTMSCHRRITVLENLDIAPFPPPKPRVVSLEAVSKKPKAILKQKNPSADQVQDSTLLEASLNGLSANDQRPPLSPAPSEISGSSRVSTSSQSFQIPGDPKSTRTGSVRSSGARSTTASLPEKTITATAELQRAGGLPGDTIPIKITINHNRKVRSPHGIIITLYRQGRIDVHPAIPVGPPGPDGKQNYEDYLPKSRTGLSGLSFGTSRSSSVFRKDLSQTFAPLIVDPVTMSATVKTSIRIPEDAFPTIGRVPGGMISFRYYVEVVVDLRGKLAAQDRFLPRLNMVSGGSNFSSSGQVFTVADKAGNSITSNWAGNILDTDQIRREKGVVAIVFEVVVGTRDSSRRPRQTTEENASLADHSAAFHSTSFDGADRYSDGHIDIGEEQYAAEGYYPNADYYYDHEEEYWDEYPTTGGQPYQSLGEVFPPPQPEEPVDEKTRLRREEEMLLPSRPPGQDEAGPSTVVATAPTAPDLPDDDPYPYNPPNSGNDAPSSAPLSSALSVETIVPGPSSAGPSEPPPARGEVQSHGDDKQELERQRLMMEASAPDPAPCGSTPAANAVPSAPVLDEEDQIISLDGGGDEALPRYQR